MDHGNDLCSVTPHPGEHGDGRLHLALLGELDSSEVAQTRIRLASMIGVHRDVVVHIDGLTFLGATGLAMFVRMHRAVRDRGGTLVFCDATPRHRRLFEWTNLQHLLGDRPTERTRRIHG